VTAPNRTPSFFSQTPDSLKAFCAEHGLAGFIATQLLEWVYFRGVVDPAAMTNISLRNRQVIAEHMVFDVGRVVRQQVATDTTQKLLIEWPPAWAHEVNRDEEVSPRPTSLPVMAPSDPGSSDRQTECVMIPTDNRNTACVSSQVGCPVGCRFCASGLGGLDGNLTAGQIVEQVHRLARLEDVHRISNVVFMGMGEPLANFPSVTQAIRTLNAPWGMGISARKITVSTVGLPMAIRKLVDFEIPVTLALSLHAPNDDLRRTLIPWAQYATIDELLDACDEYFRKTGREITLEYLLLRNVNDRPEHAEQLAGLARRLRANVNLIRYNEVKGLPFDRPTTDDVREFQNTLRLRRVNAHIRASRGRDIAAACGQLRHEHQRDSIRLTSE
jgi:23S rRNA (adenine2503-C2)-methyltransferase